MKAYRVVAVTAVWDFNKCFTVTGGLKRQQAGELYRSARAAMDAAEEIASNGGGDWHAFVVRRERQGWSEYRYFPAANADQGEPIHAE